MGSGPGGRVGSLTLRICIPKFWPKVTFTLAWGIAPGTRANIPSFGRRLYSPPCIRQCE